MPIETAVITVGKTDIQIASIRRDDDFITRLSLIEIGPRGGITFAAADLSDDDRYALILMLGGSL